MTKKTEKSEADVKDLEGFDLKIYKVPEGQKRAGFMTFSVNGRESAYYSTNSAGLQRTINMLLNGRSPGTITLRAVKAGAKVNMGEGKEGTRKAELQDPNSWADLPTLEERMEAFFSRGKLGQDPKEAEKAQQAIEHRAAEEEKRDDRIVKAMKAVDKE